MNYEQLINYLFDNSNPKFATFSKTLSNSDYQVIGIKNPQLRQIIKDHVDDNEMNLDDFKLGVYLEIDFIYFGLSLSRLKESNKQLAFLKEKIRYAKSWAITDCISTFLKKVSFVEFYDFFLQTYKSKHTYERRMAYVLALKQYKDKSILKILDLIQLNEQYMVMMAQAWLLSVIAIVYEDKIYDYLANCPDIVLKRKTISKISDSFRFDNTSKDRFKSLR